MGGNLRDNWVRVIASQKLPRDNGESVFVARMSRFPLENREEVLDVQAHVVPCCRKRCFEILSPFVPQLKVKDWVGSSCREIVHITMNLVLLSPVWV